MLIDRDKAIEAIDKVRDLISVEAYCAITERLKMIPTAKGDLISRQDAIDKAYRLDLSDTGNCETIYVVDVEEIKKLPTAEPHIIRCKDCKNRYSYAYCPSVLETNDDDFCSKAERRKE